MNHRLLLYIILLCAALPFIQAATPEVKQAIDEYQQVLDGMEGIRTFRFDEGTPESLYYVGSDIDGYPWFTSSSPDMHYCYRHDGNGFRDMFQNYPAVERDSIVSVQIDKHKRVYCYGNSYLYQWEGHKWTSFGFAPGDAILRMLISNGDVFCMGKAHYAVLSKGTWRIHPIPAGYFDLQALHFYKFTSLGDNTNVFENYYLSGTKNDVLLSMPYRYQYESPGSSQYTPLPPEGATYLRVLSPQGADSLIVISKDQHLEYDQKGLLLLPAVHTALDGGVWIYYPTTNLVFNVDLKARKVIPRHLDGGARMIGILYSPVKVAYRSAVSGNSEYRDVREWMVYTNDGKVHAWPLNDPGISGKASISCDLPTGADPAIDKMFIHIGEAMAASSLFGKTPRRFFGYHLDQASGRLQQTLDIVPNELGVSSSWNGYSAYEYGSTLTHFYSVKDPDLPNVHSFNIFHFSSGRKYQIRLTDTADKLRMVFIDDKGMLAMLEGRGQYYLVPLSRRFRKVYTFNDLKQEGWHYNYFMRSGPTPYLVRDRMIGSENWVRTSFRIDKGLPSTAVSYPFRNPTPTGDGDLLWYDMPESNIYDLYNIGPNSGRNTKLTTLDLNRVSIVKTFMPYLVFNDSTLVWELWDRPANPNADYRMTATGNMQALKNVMDPLLSPYKLSASDAIRRIHFGFLLLPEAKLFYQSSSQGMPIYQKAGNYSFTPEESSYYPDMPGSSSSLDAKFTRFELVKGTQPQLRIPSFVLDLKTGKLEIKPNWVQVHQTGKDYWLRYLEKVKGVWQYRSSRYVNGSAQPKDDDFILPAPDGKHPIRNFFLSRDSAYYESNDDRLFHHYSGEWKSIEISEMRRNYGDLQQVENGGPDLWLRFANAIVKYNTANTLVSVFTSAEGMRIDEYSSILSLWENTKGSKDKSANLLIANRDGIWTLDISSTSAHLNVPYITAGKEVFGTQNSVILKPRQNSFLVQVDILHALDPAKFQVEYRLTGYDAQAKRRAWTPQIEYSKVPSGKYILEVKAFSPEGLETNLASIPITVKTPFFATWWAILIYIAFGIAATRALFVWRTGRLKKSNRELEEKIVERTRELQDKNERITQSIEYASLIQRSILPQEDDLTAAFANHFAIWQPRDVVGGDFFFVRSFPSSGETLVAVIDCTGHGVPGAMLSVTVSSLLDTIVKETPEADPATILKQLHIGLGKALHQESRHTQQDGVEIALLRIDPTKRAIAFAGAGLNLLLRDPLSGKLQVHSTPNRGIGGLKWHNPEEYASLTITYAPGTIIYLHTDGIVDQPDPDKARSLRLGRDTWLNFLESICHEEPGDQYRLIQRYIATLLEYHEQRDDITILGFIPKDGKTT
jgi:serine phosphatase RsbU (regulator of sigma subunit)